MNVVSSSFYITKFTNNSTKANTSYNYNNTPSFKGVDFINSKSHVGKTLKKLSLFALASTMFFQIGTKQIKAQNNNKQKTKIEEKATSTKNILNNYGFEISNKLEYSKTKKNVIFLDHLKPFDINFDGIPDKLSHGDLSRFYMQSKLAKYSNKVKIMTFSSKNTTKIAGMLKLILQDVKNGKRCDGINMSLCLPHSNNIKFKETNKNGTLKTIKINTKNINQNKQLLKNNIDKWHNIKNNNCIIKDMIYSLEELSKLGVKIYIGSGNNKNEFNILSLADGKNIKVVTGTDKNGKVLSYFSQSFATDKAQGYFKVKSIGPYYDINEDGTSELDPKAISGPLSVIQGTSFASPMAFTRDLLLELEQEEEEKQQLAKK